MTKQDIINEAQKLLFEKSSHLSREDYRDLMEEMESQCRSQLDCMDEEDALDDE